MPVDEELRLRRPHVELLRQEWASQCQVVLPVQKLHQSRSHAFEEVYVSQPEGYVDETHCHKVLKLSNALYGLRQTPRAWNIQLQ
ncbi:hypothetical protein LXL04_012493 [Taraxacum kok-saghyz]